MVNQSYIAKINNAILNIVEFLKTNDFTIHKSYNKYTIYYKNSDEILTWLYPCDQLESGNITYKNNDAYNDIDGEAVCYICELEYLLYAKDILSISQSINNHEEIDTSILNDIYHTKEIDDFSYSYNDLLDIALNNKSYTKILFNHCEGLEAEDYYTMYLNKEFILVNYENNCYLLYTNGLSYKEYMDNVQTYYSNLNEKEILYAELASQYGEFPPDDNDIAYKI
ncbi:MAG: hypothetical protein LUF02_00585 [Erysipelotrichaceae bacterium]|nr:hypothetical protein [Erysipelotrichaceae bacterium]